MAARPLKAYLAVFGGMFVHLTLGTFYTFGNLTPYVTSYLRNSTSEHDMDYSDSVWIFATAAVGQGLSMFLGGIISRRLGLRITVLLGAGLMSSGVTFTYFTIQHSYIGVILTYGLMVGLGAGVAYSLPVSCAMKWFPERKGMAGGLVVAGFGGGAFIFNLVQTAFINPGNLSPDLQVNGEKYFTQPELLDRVPWVFVLTGGVYVVMQLVGVAAMREPLLQEFTTEIEPTADFALGSDSEEQTTKETPTEGVSDSANSSDHVQGSSESELSRQADDLSPLQVLRTRAFYTIWLCFLLNGQGVVLLSSLYKDYGQTFIDNDVFLAVTGAFAAVFNFSGRMFWGFIADRFSYKIAMLCLCTSFCSLMITFNSTRLGGKPLFFIYVCLLYGTLAGNFALFSVAVARSFGQTHYAINYGLAFTSQVVTAPLGAIFASQLKTQIGWFGLFSMITGFTFLSLLLTTTFNVKNKKGRNI
ncbi:apicoplast pyruvate carrier 1-like [Haliotis cracherodii]|uniref:apicoplast pyruvate carrier 1-like n=1 Tax=Haliotis cracherodii TaxID=6455 RepID=UPI0039EA5770